MCEYYSSSEAFAREKTISILSETLVSMGFKGSGQKLNDISTNTIISIDFHILINGKESSANCGFYGFNDPSTQQNVNPAVNAPVVSLMMARGPV